VPESDAPFSQIVLDDCYAYLAGVVAADFPHGLAVLGDVGAETRVVMGVISDMLNEVGLNLEDVVKAEVHLADLNDFDAMDAVYRSISLLRFTQLVQQLSPLNCSADQK